MFFSKGRDTLPDERLHLGILLAGDFEPATWRRPALQADFYTAKGVLVALLDALGVRWRLIAGGPPFLHPGRAAEVVVDAREAGWLGELHPAVAADFGLGDLERPPVVLELDLDVVLPVAERVTRRYEDLITYPAVVQDIAVVVDEARRGAHRGRHGRGRGRRRAALRARVRRLPRRAGRATDASRSRCGSSSARPIGP